MPVSKSGKLYYTEEQYRYARYECSALEYAKANGYELIKNGSYYTLKDHDSFVFGKNGMWFWNSRDMRGGAIEFLTQIEHCSTVEAILTLNREYNSQQAEQPITPRPPGTYRKTNQESAEDKKPFVLPEKAGSYKGLFAYLIQTRKLDKDIIQSLVQQKLIYQSVNKFNKNGVVKEIYNAVFVSYNEQGEAVAAFQRGIVSVGKPFKGDVPGSDKENYGWFMPGNSDATTICVFEASIDAISHATLDKMRGNDYMTAHRMALGGNVNHNPIMRYLATHPEVKNIRICLDNDDAGQKGVAALCALLKEHGYTKDNGYRIFREKPSDANDFNEMLQAYHAAPQPEEQRDESSQPEAEI